MKIIFFLVMVAATAHAATIKGKLKLDNSWQSVVYLSMINSFDDLNTASYDFLVFEAPVDSTGYFEMTGMILPEDYRLYRLHIVKKGDPVSTIIIGGKDENFIHLTMNEKSEIELVSDEDKPEFQNSLVKGGEPNRELQYLFNLQKELQAPPALPSKQNREMLKEQVLKKYQALVDTSSFSIIKLMAIYLMMESAGKPDLELMEKVKSNIRFSDSSSPYYQAFVDQLDYLKFHSEKSVFTNPAWIKWAGLIALIIFIGFAYWGRVRRKLTSRSKPKTELVSSLSIQEKRVFDLLKTGASNKEISSELNIEVSTVKSHVNKIYSRLGVKSRKEIVNKDWE